jgi:hypothetical protein
VAKRQREGKEIFGGELRHKVPQFTSKPPCAYFHDESGHRGVVKVTLSNYLHKTANGKALTLRMFWDNTILVDVCGGG